MIRLSTYRAAVVAMRAAWNAERARHLGAGSSGDAITSGGAYNRAAGALFEEAGIPQDSHWTPARATAQRRILASIERAAGHAWGRVYEEGGK